MMKPNNMLRKFYLYLPYLLVLSVASCSDPRRSVQISVTFGKAYAYSPHSNEVLDWSGNLTIKDGELDSIFKLTYGITNWEKGYGGCSREYSTRIDKPEWTTDIRPGSGRGLEGIRFFLTGREKTRITIGTMAGTADFLLKDLMDQEYLEFRTGGKYSFQPIAVFLGPDARPRLSKRKLEDSLLVQGEKGSLIIPDEFSGKKTNFMSTWCSVVKPGDSIYARFPAPKILSTARPMPITLQLMAGESRSTEVGLETTSGWMEFEVKVGNHSRIIRHFFTFFRQAQKLFDINLDIPGESLTDPITEITILNHDTLRTLLLHRVFVNHPPVSHMDAVISLPPLPEVPTFWVGYDLNTLTPQNGEVDTLINRMHREQMGNYVLFRIEENHSASPGDFARWGDMIRQRNFKAGSTMDGPVSEILRKTIGDGFIGVHRHEASNLIYGWGDSEPKESRASRTLADCEEAYKNRVAGIGMLGQALPMCNLDYRSGVGFISSEFPTGHSTLMMAANRGGSYMYDKPAWGVHLANHVMRMPDDETTLRRNFILLWQSWLYGAKLIYDEESAVYGLHSTSYSWSDRMSYMRRQQMQELYHYGSSINLGKELVSKAFLIGKYDCLVGGVQSSPEMNPTSVWGMFGPETKPWEFNTPERGWLWLDAFMPGVWLYPVNQDVSKIRMFFSASPYGQTDLVTIDGDAGKLDKYQLLVLPGWNSVTDENYDKLIGYVSRGGHLVIAATQLTNHVKRDFLLDKRDFDFYKKGDLSSLCGIRVGEVSEPITSVKWTSGKTCETTGIPGLVAELQAGTKVLVSTENHKPFLVEKRMGKGRVWTLIAGEYWGEESLDPFREQLCDTLRHLYPGDTRISGETEDIDFHVYELDNQISRIALLNTDWTSPGNKRNVKLNHHGFEIPVSVAEGKVTMVMAHPEFAVSFEIPGSDALILPAGNEGFKIRLSGVGRKTFDLHSLGKLELLYIENPSIRLENQKLNIDFGEQWNQVFVELK